MFGSQDVKIAVAVVIAKGDAVALAGLGPAIDGDVGAARDGIFGEMSCPVVNE